MLLLHVVGCLYSCIRDARWHKHQKLADHVPKVGEICNVHTNLLWNFLVNSHNEFFKVFSVLRIRCWFVWDVILCQSVFGSRRFEVGCWNHLQGGFDRWWEIHYIGNSGTIHGQTHRYFSEQSVSEQHWSPRKRW